MATKLVYGGARFQIELLVSDDGKCQVNEFLEELDASDRRKLDVLFEYLGEQGRISNKEKFKKLEGTDGLYEFKSFQIRLICFYTSDKRVIVCRALKKKRDKHDRTDLDYAADCKRRFET